VQVFARQADLEALSAFVARVADGPAGFVVEGESGIGKTTVWDAGVEDARARSYRVLECRPAGSEVQLSYAALGDLLDDVLDDVLEGLSAPRRRALEVALLLEDPHGSSPDQRAVGLAVLDGFRTLASFGPLLVAVDDAQWLDAPSKAVLEFALRRVHREPVGVLYAVRPSGGLDLGRELPVERIRLEPLSASALHRVIRAHLDIALTRPELLRVHEASGGNPFYALELARALGGSGDAEDVLRERVAALPDDVRELLLVVALLADPTLPQVEAVVPGADALLRSAIDDDLLRRDGDRLRFPHPLLAAAVSAQAGSERKRRLHRRLAELEHDPEARARHLALATEGQDADVAAALDLAAQSALARGAPSAAAELLELAIARTPPGPDVDLRGGRLAAADAHFSSGAIARANAILQELVDELPPGDERADVLVRLAQGSPDLEAALELAERARDEAADDEAVLSRVHLLLGQAWPLRGMVASLEDGRLALDHAERAGDRRLIVDVLARLTLWELFAGRDPNELIDRAVALEHPDDTLRGYQSPRMSLGLLRMYQGRLDEAREIFERLLAESLALGDEIASLAVRGRLVDVALRAGDWSEASAHAEDAFELAEQVGLDHDAGTTVYWKALVAAHLGLVDDARSLAETGASIAAAAKHENRRVTNLGVLGFLELSLGDDAGALAKLEPILDWIDARALGLVTNPAAPYAIEALVAAGRMDEAERLLDAFEQEARTIASPWAEAVAGRYRALIASTPDSLDQPDECWPFERAQTLLARGRLQRRAKRKAAAKESLEHAVAIFDELPAPLWSQRAADELARVGLRRGSSDDLTETEQRVAELAASGLTNREVAAQLFMSPKTVEANIARVYRKLGIKSRAQLGARLAQM
jgi:DNA-binding CsgD family transcriptional regulator